MSSRSDPTGNCRQSASCKALALRTGGLGVGAFGPVAGIWRRVTGNRWRCFHPRAGSSPRRGCGVEYGGLIERCPVAPGAYCGLFTVPKRNGLSRVIFDARPANERLARHKVRFSTFHLGDLLRCWQEVGGAVSTVDYRHFFYQIPWRTRYDGSVSLSHGERWQPRVVTMGWQDAPLCAQTITWMAVLHREAEEDSLGIQPVFRGEALPQYAVVNGRKASPIGYIFVLLDGIAVMGARRELHGAIMKRILRNTKLFGIAIKEQGENEFAGVAFLMQDGRPVWRALAPLPPWEPPRTRRQVAQRLGSLLWFLRVHQVPLLDKESLLRLFARVGAAVTPWSAPFPLSPCDLAGLKEEWEHWCTERLTAGIPGCSRSALRWWWVVTDATPTSIAYLFLNRDGSVLRSSCGVLLGSERR